MKTAEQALAEVGEVIVNDAHAVVGAMSQGDAYAQGDVLIVYVADELPSNWKEDIRQLKQLAPGTSQGSRHIAEGPVTIYENRTRDELIGPRLFATGEWTLTHPEHGDRTFGPGAYEVRYQRRISEEGRRLRSLD
jgi:hypothetical protein